MTKRFLLAVLWLFWSTSAFAQRDAIDLSTAVVWNSPPDVASWPITTRLTSLTMRPASAAHPGLEFQFPARATWPDWIPPGFEGPLQYTVWAGVRINGVWHVAGFIRMWRDRVATGAPILTDRNFAVNWAYDGRWGAMAGYQPVAGEAMIFFVTAGVARGFTTVTSVRERSNVVMVNLPANDTGVFTFPDVMTDLVVDLDSQGLWTLTDAAAFRQIHPLDPELVAVGDFDGNRIDELAIDFGPSYGLWIRWNGSSWGQLHPISPSVLATGDVDGNGTDELLIGFPGAGFFAYFNGGVWWKINDAVPTRVVVANIDGGGGGDIVADFPGGGVWILFNRTRWFQLHTQNATDFVAANIDGAGFDDLALMFPGGGVWLWLNASAWAQVNPSDPRRIAAGRMDGDGRAELVIDFPGYGVWVLRGLAAWSQLHSLPTRHIVLADLDGSGIDEVIVDFGPGHGIWIWANDAAWVGVTTSSAASIAPGDLN